MLNLKRVLASAPRKHEEVEFTPLLTPWGEELQECSDASGARDAGLQGKADLHPNPQFARKNFTCLEGWWDYAFVASQNASDEWKTATKPETWDGLIRVPFSPEALLSGVGRQLKPTELLWYRRAFEAPEGVGDEKRCFLHFEAVDYACACYCNGELVGHHVGGYTPFVFDVTDMLVPGENELALCVYDPSEQGVQLRGKQKLARADIWYTAQGGIWQSVWMEVVPKTHLASLEVSPDADTGRVVLKATVVGDMASQPVCARIKDGAATVAQAEAMPEPDSVGSFGAATLVLEAPQPKLWSPEHPYLYDIELTFGDDAATSYCAFRTVGVEADEAGVPRFCLNHKPLFLRGVLDQGYWSDGLLTPPSDEAMVYDIETMKAFGFNMLRKHIKLESNRWYYHCDRLGMLVWQDMVSGGSPYIPWEISYKPTFFRSSWSRQRDDDPNRFDRLSSESEAFREEWTRTCKETVRLLKNHPCIVSWVLFNEGWGQFEARKATEMVRALDPTRPIDAVSGWYDQVCGDFQSVHNYFRPLEVYPDRKATGRAFVLSEFGGLSYYVPDHASLETSYGYATFANKDEFRAAVQEVLAQADALESQGLAGFVYTQLSDVEEETNGLLTYDRRINKLS